jgi:hypothetical protein
MPHTTAFLFLSGVIILGWMIMFFTLGKYDKNDRVSESFHVFMMAVWGACYTIADVFILVKNIS